MKFHVSEVGEDYLIYVCKVMESRTIKLVMKSILAHLAFFNFKLVWNVFDLVFHIRIVLKVQVALSQGIH